MTIQERVDKAYELATEAQGHVEVHDTYGYARQRIESARKYLIHPACPPRSRAAAVQQLGAALHELRSLNDTQPKFLLEDALEALTI